MSVMAKRKQDGSTPKRPTANRVGVPFYVYLHPDIQAALAQFLEASEARISKTAFTEMAFKEVLRARGFWPYKPDRVPPADD